MIKPEEYLISRLCYKLIEKWPWGCCGQCGSFPVQKQSWRHHELWLLTSLQPTFTVFLLPSGYPDFQLPLPSFALQRPAHCPQFLLPPLPSPPPHPCLGTYPCSPELSLLPLWFPTASSLHEAMFLFLAWSPRHTRELSRKLDLISLLSLLLVLVHLTGETRFAGTRRRLQRKKLFPNELCCLQALSAVHLGGEKGKPGCIFGT